MADFSEGFQPCQYHALIGLCKPPAKPVVVITLKKEKTDMLQKELAKRHRARYDTETDAETFCNRESAIFIIMPEENPNTFFMISLIFQQLY